MQLFCRESQLPRCPSPSWHGRVAPQLWARLLLALAAGLPGCTSAFQRTETAGVDLPVSEPRSFKLVGDLARPWGANWLEVEGVSLAVGLAGTGSDPRPSAERAMMMNEMQVRDVKSPDKILASPDTSLVLVRALVPPGAQQGDRLDVDVRTPSRSETRSLQAGWVMMARLREYALLNNRLSSGHPLALCEGSILVDTLVQSSDDPVLLTRGRILGGAVVTESRDLGLRLRDDHLSVRTSARVGQAINERFHVYARGDRQGVATPKRDSFVSLLVHPRYRKNIIRYVRVIESIPVQESRSELASRLRALQPRLMNPRTASDTAVKLEAIGAEGEPVLKTALTASNPEVRFYAAEALAYLDHPEAAPVLGEAIRQEPAFRWRGFRALGAMDHHGAHDELALLLHEASAETRYEAFRTLHELSAMDPLVKGEMLEGRFSLHVVDTTGEPMVHVATSERPEIVIFGRDLLLTPPVMLFAGRKIAIRDTEDGRLRIRQLASDDSGQHRVVDAKLEAMVRVAAELGGSYVDVVRAISDARQHGCLTCRVEFGALPTPGRRYRRLKSSELPAEPRDAQDEAALDSADPPSDGWNLDETPVELTSGASAEFSVGDLPDRATGDEADEPQAPGEVRLVDDEFRSLLLFPDDDSPPAAAAVVDQIGP